ncbi:MAG: glutamate 5-kinase [Tannerellaceae bacterium]|jgi:glutamate 5-kinase|nr:glutamate 5-kinase [Tannerellaceae bacterium]
MYSYKRIAVKIGSQALARADGKPDVTQMSAIVDQIASLHADGIDVVIISSGAVASGRGEIKTTRKLDAISSRQLYSAVGQARLINRYYELFREYGIICGQVLTTKENFASRTHYLNQKRCMEVMLDNDVIPIVNENDTVAVTELMFTDNDELGGLIAAMMNMDALVILSNVDGIYAPGTTDVIAEISREDDLSALVQPGKSSFGRGGMLTKCKIARKVADEGIEVIIANGRSPQILPRVLEIGSKALCTRFPPAPKAVSSLKKWIAHSDDFAKGEIYLNPGAVEALLGPKAVSVLPVGVTAVKGTFDRDDIVLLINHEGRRIGVGCAACDSAEASAMIGKRDAKPLIHYDYLYLD